MNQKKVAAYSQVISFTACTMEQPCDDHEVFVPKIKLITSEVSLVTLLVSAETLIGLLRNSSLLMSK